MKKLMLVVSVAALLAASAFAQSKQGNLEDVLNLLDKTSASFKSVQTDFVWDQYEEVVNDHDIPEWRDLLPPRRLQGGDGCRHSEPAPKYAVL